jgi:hypothetical protein
VSMRNEQHRKTSREKEVKRGTTPQVRRRMLKSDDCGREGKTEAALIRLGHASFRKLT